MILFSVGRLAGFRVLQRATAVVVAASGRFNGADFRVRLDGLFHDQPPHGCQKAVNL